MCSVSDDIEEINVGNCSESFSNERQSKRSLNECKKCGEQAVVVLQKKDPFCKPCFIIYCNHKFKSTIGKSKKVKSGSKVLICHSGGSSSTAMLHMVVQALKDVSPKKLLLKPGILHIDESFLMPQEGYLESEVVCAIERDAKTLDCPVHLSSLDKVLCDPKTSQFYWKPADLDQHKNCQSIQRLNHILSGIKSLSSKQEYIEQLRMRLMVDIAEQAGYEYLFVGDSATYLANKALTSITFGRGSQIACNSAFYDSRYSVPVCRPLRELLSRELAFYNKLNDLQYFVQPSLLTMTDASSSVQRITETFISNLQENFPATVFTIFRTAGKVTAKSLDNGGDRCILCESIQDNVNSPSCSALEAMKLTSKLSRSHSKLDHEPKNDTCNDDLESHSSSENNSSFMHHLCHGCQVLLADMKCPQLPASSEKKFTEIKQREEMKKKIEQFLLDPDDENDAQNVT